MKNKYQRLSTSEKKECRNMYYRSQSGKAMHLRLVRLMIFGLVGILFSLYEFFHGMFVEGLFWYDYLLIIPLFIASIVFIIGAICIRYRVLNQFALKIPRFKNK